MLDFSSETMPHGGNYADLLKGKGERLALLIGYPL